MTPNEQYEKPEITVLGTVSDTVQAKPGVYFDFGNCNQGDDNVRSFS